MLTNLFNNIMNINKNFTKSVASAFLVGTSFAGFASAQEAFDISLGADYNFSAIKGSKIKKDKLSDCNDFVLDHAVGVTAEIALNESLSVCVSGSYGIINSHERNELGEDHALTSTEKLL